jgi:O-antigen ligase
MSSDRAAGAAGVPALLVPTAYLAALLFLLSADHLHVIVAGHKLKWAYFLVLGAWAFAPGPMVAALRGALARVPRLTWLPLAPLAFSVAFSVDLRDSIAWTLWLAFDLFTVGTVYAFLKAQGFTGDQVRRSALWALGLLALFGFVQYVAIYYFHNVIFSPQSHVDVYRLNGLAGWPHFLNIYAFLLLPIVLVQRNPGWATRGVLVALVFVLVESTAKTGWVLFVVLGGLLLALDRRVFRHSFLMFLLPVTIIAMQIPTPSFTAELPTMSATDKMGRFARDLDVGNPTTSGTDRVLISRMGLEVWWRHPWFGVGPRAYDHYVFEHFDRELPGTNKLDANRMVNAKNENIWVEFLSESGALFTLAFVFVLVRTLWTPRWAFGSRLHLGAWTALVLYFGVSGQFSQTGLLTLVYAVLGIYLYARELVSPERMPRSRDEPRSRAHPLDFESTQPLAVREPLQDPRWQ